MPTEHDALEVGLRILLNDVPTETLADVLVKVIGNQMYQLMQLLEDRSDIIQPVVIDVDEVLEHVDENDDIEWGEAIEALDEDARKLAVRGKMDDMRDDDYISEQKWKMHDHFITHLQEEGWLVKPEAAQAEEADGAATAGADSDH